MKEKLYNISIIVLAVISVYFAIVDFTRKFNQVEIWIDRIIYCIFVIDYAMVMTLYEKLSEEERQMVLNDITKKDVRKKLK